LVLGWRTKDLATEEDAHRVAAELILQLNAHNPRPLDGPRRGLAATPGNDLTAAHPKQLGNPGYSPDRRVAPGHLRTRLRGYLAHLPRGSERSTSWPSSHRSPSSPRRLATPPATIERHAVDSAAASTRYVAAVRET
jgi:hypothetical protein